MPIGVISLAELCWLQEKSLQEPNSVTVRRKYEASSKNKCLLRSFTTFFNPLLLLMTILVAGLLSPVQTNINIPSNQRLIHIVRHKYPDGRSVDKVYSGPTAPLTLEDVIRLEKPEGRAIVKHQASLYAVPQGSPVGTSLSGGGIRLGTVSKTVESTSLGPTGAGGVGAAGPQPYVISDLDRPTNQGPLSNMFLRPPHQGPMLLPPPQTPLMGLGSGAQGSPNLWKLSPLGENIYPGASPGPQSNLFPHVNWNIPPFTTPLIDTLTTTTTTTTTTTSQETLGGKIMVPEEELPYAEEKEFEEKMPEEKNDEEREEEEEEPEKELLPSPPPQEIITTLPPVETSKPFQRFIDRVGAIWI